MVTQANGKIAVISTINLGIRVANVVAHHNEGIYE